MVLIVGRVTLEVQGDEKTGFAAVSIVFETSHRRYMKKKKKNSRQTKNMVNIPTILGITPLQPENLFRGKIT